MRYARRGLLSVVMMCLAGAPSCATRPHARPDSGSVAGKAALGAREVMDVDGRTFRYALYVPPNYNAAQKMPLLICLHGAMFTGASYMERWVPRLGDEYILVCPTFTPKDTEILKGTERKIWGHWWSKRAEGFVLALLDRLGRQYTIDRDRIVLAGMSNGGVGAYYFAVRYPHLFSAVVPMAGAVPESDWPRIGNLANLSVYLIHGAADTVMPVADTDKVYKVLTGKVHDLFYERHDWVHPQAGGHFFPRQALPKLIDWLADKRRDPHPQRISIGQDSGRTGRFFWVGVDRAAEVWSMTATREANRIHVECSGVLDCTFYLSKDWIDFSRPVSVTINGILRHNALVAPSDELRMRSKSLPITAGDPYDAALPITVNSISQ